MNPLPLVDTHAHLDFPQFDPDRDAVLQRAAEAGVQAIVMPAVDEDAAQRLLHLAETHGQARPRLFVAVGVHPNSVAQAWRGQETLAHLARWLQHPNVVAVGEIGLDYYRMWTPKAQQRAALEAQLELAARAGKPVILHQRESADDLLAMLRDWVAGLPPEHPRGVLHSFSAPWEVAETALALGFYIGFTGPVTFKKAHDLRAVAARVPLERLLVETDAPFLAPHPYRGRRNEPAYVRFVVEKIAEVRNLPAVEVARQTTRNAQRLFGLPADRAEGPESAPEHLS